MDIQITAVFVAQGVCLDFFDAFFDCGKTDKLSELLFAFADVYQLCSHWYKETESVYGNQFLVHLKKLILGFEIL